ncbi:MAG: hypothetical protein J6Z49_02535 [Kiritimatiellae bacterium]|nr:hypothetical protein [Kiritimatiellia bacterium]
MKPFLAIFLLLAGTASADFSADLSNGDVSLRLSATPDKVSPASDFMVTLTLEAPSGLSVTLPDLRDRFQGFSLAEDFSDEPVEAGGRTRTVYRWRLEPEPAAERYRLAPFAVRTLEGGASASTATSYATPPVVFPAEGERAPVTGATEVSPEPVHIPPTAKTITIWGGCVLIGLAFLACLVWLTVRLTNRVRVALRSPIENARIELARLLERDLPSRGLFKEFYIELTMVVRRYIERTHGIRAPRQTTEEFLCAVKDAAGFPPETVAQLQTFLESADLVKFAGKRADSSMTDEATDKARTYMETDAQKEASHDL